MRVALALASLVFLASPALAETSGTVQPSFNCTRARSINEHLICSDPELAELDRALNVVFSAAKIATIDPKALATDANQKWLWREKNCADKECLIEWYRARGRELNAVLIGGAQEDHQAVPARTTAQTPVNSIPAEEASTRSGGQYDSEMTYIAAFKAARINYDAAPNDLKRSSVFVALKNRIPAIVPGMSAVNWIGTIAQIGTTGNGDAYIKIEVAENNFVMTTNNDFSDALDHSLIKNGSKLYEVISNLGVGSKVRFSATLSDFIDITERGKVEEPEMVAHFTSIEPVN